MSDDRLTPADLAHVRALRDVAASIGPNVVSALLRHIESVERERDALHAIIEGRTTAPTDAEIEAHHAAGGSWLAGDTVTWLPDSLRAMRDDGEAEGIAWVALDRDDRPCAWPEVPRG